MGCLVQNDSKLMIQSYPTGSVVYTLRVLLNHLEDGLLSLLGAGRTQVVASTINKGERSFGA